jgi:hypothetical protein
MAFELLNSFREAAVPPNSLVVLDIDDTVMKFEHMGRSWWAKKEAEVGREETMRIWVENAYAQTPVLTEPEEFPAFLERIFAANARLVYLTARSPDLRELTIYQLTQCGVGVESHNVYFAKEKGECLKAIVQRGGFKQVIFIDDMEHNVESVVKELSGICEIQAYHFHKFK